VPRPPPVEGVEHPTEVSWEGLHCNLEVCGGGQALMADRRLDSPGGPAC
jgi:hypothetical protein